MSFLNSVLSSINDGKTAIAAPTVKPTKKDISPSETRSSTLSSKRKAPSELDRLNGKHQKSSTSSKGPSDAPNTNISAGLPINSKSTLPKPVPQAVKSAPKKGSFAEILARGKQNSAISVGQLTHKRQEKEKLSTKKELLLQREQSKSSKKNSKEQSVRLPPPAKASSSVARRTAEDSKLGNKDRPSTSSEKGPSKPRPQPTYQGTAKPKATQPKYHGTMKPSSSRDEKRGYNSEPDRGRSKPSQQNQRGGYSDYGSNEEENESDGYDYASEDYSDMDAGFDDVDDEEAAAEQEARREDSREQRMLEELARQKQERKKRAMLAAAREQAWKR